MKLSTILKAGTLALDIFNHKSTQQLSGLVQNGIKRRTSTHQSTVKTQPSSPRTGAHEPMRSSAPHHIPYGPPAHRGQNHGHPQGRQPDPFFGQEWPVEHIKKALKYATPDNLEKAMRWHGVIKSFFSKD